MNRRAHALRAIGAVMVLLTLMMMTPKLLAQPPHAAVSARGEVSVVIFENIQAGRAELRYYLVDERGREKAELFFDGPPPGHVRTGKHVTVRGRGRPNAIHVEEVTLDAGPADDGTGAEAPLAPPQTRNVLTLLVDFNDATVNGPGMSYGVTLQEARDIMFNRSKNVADFYWTASLETLTIPPDPDNDGIEDVFGPYQIDDSYIGGDSAQCSPSTWVSLASQAWQDANPGKDINLYRHRNLIVPNYWDYGNRHCGWGGVAQVGCGSWCWAVNADPDTILHGVIIHELGHNLGFNHARVDSNNDGVTDSEYGDGSDMMGSSRNWMKFNAPHAEDQGWVDPVAYEIRDVTPGASAQVFDLIPMDEESGPWPGLRALKIPRTADTHYFVTYRQNEGAYNNVSGAYTQGLNIHYGYLGSSYSYFVEILPPGQTFTDPYGNTVIRALDTVVVTGTDGLSTTRVAGVEVCQDLCSSLAAPSGLGATALSTSQIDLAWQDNTSDESGFELQRSLNGSSWSALATLGADATAYLDSGLATGTTYFYRVRAFNIDEQSGWSNVASEQTDAIAPNAAFGWSANYTEVSFSDQSGDPDGSVVGWSWNFGDGTGSSAQNPVHSYAAAGSYTVTLTVTDNHGASDQASQPVSVDAPPFQEFFAVGDSSVAGLVSGSYTATHADDGGVQAITERESGGKPSNRYSYLEHRWTFNIPGGDATVLANAWQSASTDNDSFDFEWSANGNAWSPLFNIAVTGDGPTPVAAMLPPGTSGTVYVRVVDTDQGTGHQALDTVFVDLLKIRVESASGDPPDGDPSGLGANAVAFDRVNLVWADNTSNESGFRIERRIAGQAWAQAEVLTAGANPDGSAAYADTGVLGGTPFEYRVRAFNALGDSAWSNTASVTTPEAPNIVLSAAGYKVKGSHQVDLTWSGAGAVNVDVFRDGVLVMITPNDTTETDAIDAKGGASYQYQLCESGTSACSNTVTVVF